MKKCPIFVHRAFFQKSLSSKNPIWGIFFTKDGAFFRSEGLPTLGSAAATKKEENGGTESHSRVRRSVGRSTIRPSHDKAIMSLSAEAACRR